MKKPPNKNEDTNIDNCNIDDPLDSWISFRIPQCKKKQIENKMKQRNIRNKSDIYRWCFFMGFEQEFGP